MYTMSDAIPKLKVCIRPSVIPLVHNHLFPTTFSQPLVSNLVTVFKF